MSSNGGTTSSPYEIFKLDDFGNEIWRNFPGDGYASSHSLMNTSSLVIDAYTTSIADEFGIITLAGIDNNSGITQWTKTFYDPSLLIDNTYPGYSLAANGACLSSTNNIYMVGSKSLMTEPLVGTPYQFIMKTDDIGNVIWSRTYSEGSFNQIIETTDGCFVVIGKSATSTGILILKLDANGDSLWSNTFSAFSTSTGMDFHETSDQGFIISGFAYEDANGQYYTYVIKTDSQGNVGNVSTVISKANTIFKNATLSPTILHERSTITLPAETLTLGNTATIIDVTGRVLRQFQITSENTTIERGTLASGTYSLLITNKQGSNVNFKFIVE
ncbi:MAG: T9SS type A sorting domain-containing protein [Bacteroidetes bacterium]|nr:T9SS type A sorting domain-containing protein [Bacteroidota bacterium]